MRTSRDMSVAAGLRPAVEGGILPPGPNLRAVHDFSAVHAVSAGQDARLNGRRDAWNVFSAMVGMARRAVPARAVAGGRKLRATPEGIAPLHAARTSQRDVPTTLNAYDACRYNGFTLMEMIGVLAVISVLVAVIAPSVIRRMDRAAWTRETADLNSIADSFTQYVLRTKTIPSYTNWASTVASQMSLPVSAVLTNGRRYARAFLIDTNLAINGVGLPYTQTTNGTTKPVSARVMIVSSLARALPASVTNGVASATNFTAIWNAAENTVPAGPAFSGWGGTGEDLRIKKLNLEPLFYQLILVNHTTATNTVPRYSIDNSSVVAVPAGGLGLNKKYYLDSTVVGMYGSNTNLQFRHLLKRNISFMFESDAWRGQIQGDQQSFSASGSDFSNHAETFFSRPTNPWGPQAQGASQYGVMIAMYTFMFDYTYWANECPHFNYHGNQASSVPEYVLLHNQGQNSGNVDQFSTQLIYVP